MKGLTIHRADKNDVQILNSISIASKMHWNYPQEWLRQWLVDLTFTQAYIAHNFVYKLLVEEETVGVIAIEENNEVYEITHLWILPKYIGKGYGKKLLNTVTAFVVKPGAEIFVESDPNAEGFYQSQGFTTFATKESYPKGRFLPFMRKKHIV